MDKPDCALHQCRIVSRLRVNKSACLPAGTCLNGPSSPTVPPPPSAPPCIRHTLAFEPFVAFFVSGISPLLGSPVQYLTSHQTDAKMRSLFSPFFFTHLFAHFVWQDKETSMHQLHSCFGPSVAFICCISPPVLFCVAGQRDLHSHSAGCEPGWPFSSVASYLRSCSVWQDKETFTATVLDVNQGGLICRCQSLQAFIPISQLNREKDTWLSPEVSCCAVLCCGSGCLPCHLLVHILTERLPFGLRFICFPILRAKCAETCCFSCILSTHFNRE